MKDTLLKIYLFYLFLEVIKVTDLLEITKSALLARVISSLRLLNSLLAFALFLVCYCFQILSIESIELIFANDI